MAKNEAPAAPAASLSMLKKLIEKKYGAGSIMQGRNSVVPVEAIPTGVASIDRALGCGGLPVGRIIEIFGLESSGKTTTTLQFVGACQKHQFSAPKNRTGVVAFIDVEHAFDPTWATNCGVDVDSLLFCQPNSGEEAIDIADTMVRSRQVDLIIIDSVAALIPKAELDGEITDSNIGGQARLMSKACRMLHGACHKTKTTIIFINQIRMKIGVTFGSPETTSGGLALKFYSSVRAQISKGSAIKEKEVVLGFRPKLKIIKNKCAPPFTTAEYEICVGRPERPVCGIDTVASLLEEADTMELTRKSSSYYYFGDAPHERCNGWDAAVAYLRQTPAAAEVLKEKIYNSLHARTVSVTEDTSGETPDELADDILDRVVDSDD